jgi:hypothetical protein
MKNIGIYLKSMQVIVHKTTNTYVGTGYLQKPF